MRELKYSGAKWLGDVPCHWNIDKLKYHLVRNEPKNPGDQIVLSLYRELGIIPKDSRDDNHNVTSEDTSKYKHVRPGDFVINKMKAWQGSVAVSDYEGIVSPAYYVYNFLDDVFHKRYFHYLLRGCYKDEFMRLSGGIRVGQWDLPSEALDNVLVLIPPVQEQESISQYLDGLCAEIDILIADVQTQIDTLEQYKRSVITETVTKGLNPDVETKDSEIQWIGMMPSHWNCIRGKYILKYIQRAVREDDGVITCFRDGEVTLRSNRREDGFTMADKEIGYQGIDVGDLVVHGMDGFAGAIGISDSRGKASPVLNVLDTEQNKRYIMYFLRSMAYSDVFLAMATGIRVRSCDLRWNKLAELFYPVPPIEEQEAIVEYIDSVLTKTNDVIAAKKEQLSILEAYKKSLIFEYVTGKKEIPVPVTAVMVDPNVILLGKLPKLLSEQKGKIYNQKVLYLLNIYLGLNLDVQYYRYKHGPYDLKLDSYIDTLTENGWCVKIDNNGAENLGIGPNYGAFEEKFGSHFSEYDAEINKLIQFVQPMKRTQLERVATLFAVWNDMILDGNSAPTDAEIVSEVMSGWTENKANSAYETWLNTLNKMKLHHIVPKGQGLHTLPKDRCTNGYTQEGGAKA